MKSNKVEGIEIKSDCDSLVRLENQIKNYSKYLEYNSILITPKYLKKIEDIIPNYWGIYLIENDELKIIRPSQPSPKFKFHNFLYFISSLNLKKYLKVLLDQKIISGFTKTEINKLTKRELISRILKTDYNLAYNYFKLDLINNLKTYKKNIL